MPLASQPGHEAACRDLYVRAELFEVVSGVAMPKGSREARGQWRTAFPAPNTCRAPALSLGDLMLKGRMYRVAATARATDTSAAPTRRVSVSTDFLAPPR